MKTIALLPLSNSFQCAGLHHGHGQSCTTKRPRNRSQRGLRMLKSNMLKALTFYERTEEKLQNKSLALQRTGWILEKATIEQRPMLYFGGIQ